MNMHETMKALGKIKATPDQRIDAIANGWADKIAVMRFKNPDAIPTMDDLRLARDLIEPLRPILTAAFATQPI